MWLSKQIRPALSTADADLGVTTIAGDSVGVMTRGEEQCVCGMKQCAPPGKMRPGEVLVYGPGGNSVYLKKDGTVELTGDVRIQGTLWVNGKAYAPCECGKENL